MAIKKEWEYYVGKFLTVFEIYSRNDMTTNKINECINFCRNILGAEKWADVGKTPKNTLSKYYQKMLAGYKRYDPNCLTLAIREKHYENLRRNISNI